MAKRVLFLLLGILVLSSSVLAQEEGAPEEKTDWENFWDALDPADAKAPIEALVTDGLTYVDAYKALKDGRDYPEAEVPTGERNLGYTGVDGKERHFFLYVPEDYDKSKKYRVFFTLHGGVNADHKGAGAIHANQIWLSTAKKEGWILVCPTGSKESGWWNPLGTANVLRLFRQIRMMYNIDENIVILNGFSDGASGTFNYALRFNTQFSAFMPFSGHLGVIGNTRQAEPVPQFVHNLANKPLLIYNGEQDRLYPASGMAPYMKMYEEAGADVTFRRVDAGHSHSYIAGEVDSILAWMGKQKRDPHPERVMVVTQDARWGRSHWAMVREIKDVGKNDKDFEDINPVVPSGKIGVGLDRNFAGPGVRITQVTDGPAKKAGIQTGDVITKFGGTDIPGAQELVNAVRSAGTDADLEVVVDRNGEEKTLKIRMEGKSVFYRKPDAKVGWFEAKREENVVNARAKNIGSFVLAISQDAFDLSTPITVYVNGDCYFHGTVERDPKFTLEMGVTDFDRTMIYAGRIPIDLSKDPIADPAGQEPTIESPDSEEAPAEKPAEEKKGRDF